MWFNMEITIYYYLNFLYKKITPTNCIHIHYFPTITNLWNLINISFLLLIDEKKIFFLYLIFIHSIIAMKF